MKAKKSSIIGLDIGSYSVKCVEVVSDGEQTKLHRVTILPFPDSTSKGLIPTLHAMMNALPTQPKRVRISLSGSSLLIRRISLPTMTRQELKGAIRFEAERHIPFSIDDCILDFQILSQSQTKKTMNILIVAAKRDFINERLKLLAEFGIQPEIIDVDILCVMNAFEMLNDAEANKVYGLLNIGHRVTSFTILQDRQPFFVREIPFGGLHVSKALAQIRNVSEDEADRLKKERSADRLEDLKAATERGFEPLLEELRHSIDYFENEAGEELKTIWLSGGGALSENAAAFLSENLGRHVSHWNNIRNMEVFGSMDMNFLEQHAQELNVAFGMVLRGLGKPK